MSQQNANNKPDCLRDEIAAYIDGELSAREELDLEMHLGVCESCAEDLNEQKKMLCALDFALIEEEREFELPKDFTKVVVTNAESKVGGLREPRERNKTLFVLAALFTLVLFGLRGETEQVFATFSKFAEQVWAVGGFAAHLVYNVSVGTTVVLRSICFKFLYSYSIVLIAFIVFALISIFGLFRAIHKFSRA